MKVAVIGGGVMGEALLARALAAGVFTAAETTVAEVIEARREAIAATYGVAVTGVPAEAMHDADFVLLAVKPQDLGRLTGTVPADAVIVSIMAGVTIATLRAAFGHARVVRVMPNTPAAIGEGMSAWTATPGVQPAQREAVRNLLGAVGREIEVDDEKKIDMATAVSGSGPAYVFLVVEALIEGAVAIGLPRAQAEELVVQTVLGSARYLDASGDSAATLRERVTSPAGTTAAGLLALEKGALRADLIEAVRAAYVRAIELGKP